MSIGEPGCGDEQPLVVIVDGANVVGSRPDGWWRDRAGAARRLRAGLESLAGRGIARPPGGPEAASGAARDVAPDRHGIVGRSAASRPGVRIILVVEGAARAVAADAADPGASVRVVAAAGSGDDTIADLAGKLAGSPGGCVVVTADRELRSRCETAGAAVTGPGWLLGQL